MAGPPRPCATILERPTHYLTELPIPEFVCPRCRSGLDQIPDAYHCSECSSDYPVILGIPDFRIFPDPWIGLEEDRSKARRLATLISGKTFGEAVRTYWEITPATPRPMAERFTQYVLGAKERALDWLDWLDTVEQRPTDGCWLDVGCGTGDMIAAGTGRNLTVVGVDIALRWLVVAARREELAGRTHQLVCANGEHLPFPAQSFARVVSLGALEHCRDADSVISESKRVLKPGGVLRVRTVNRYSLMPEPHVGVWGVGMVPRKMADAYVHWRSGQRYEHHRPLSPRELARGFRRGGFQAVRVRPAAMLAADRARIGGPLRAAAPLYELLARTPGIGSVIKWVTPLLDARGVAI